MDMDAIAVDDGWNLVGASGSNDGILTTPNGGKTHFNQAYIYDMTSIFD